MNEFVASLVKKLARPGGTEFFLVIPEEGTRAERVRLKVIFGEEQHFFPQQELPTPVLQVPAFWGKG